MRWERLFADLEARFEELADEQALAELAERQRHAAGRVTLVQRCIGALDTQVRLLLRGGTEVAGQLLRVGPDWLLLAAGAGQDLLIALDAVEIVRGLTDRTGQPLAAVETRCDLRLALRGLARDRAPAIISIGRDAGSTDIAGTIDRVGADFIEVAHHPVWEPRRADHVRTVGVVPIGSIVMVRSQPLG